MPINLKGLLVLCVEAAVISFLMSLLHSYIKNERNYEHSKCPACYGDTLCKVIESTPSLVSYDNDWLYYFDVRNVFHGTFNSNRVVFKKLAQDWEFKEFDDKLKQICHRLKLGPQCNTSLALTAILTYYQGNVSSLVKHEPDLLQNSDPISCSQSSSALNFLLKEFEKGFPSGKKEHFITMLAVNPEPLIFQVRIVLF